jgi:superfamily II DNA or RNA helicase
VLSDADRLQLQQLRLLAWVENHSAAEQEPTGGEESEQARRPVIDGSGVWKLTRGLEPRPWQLEAADAWFAAGERGTIKVVTGAGKTVLALDIAERLHRRDPELRVAVVVPTIVLMNQWNQFLRDHSNLPAGAVGRLGGGHSDDFTGETRVLIAVLASARKELPRFVHAAGVGEHLLFIADECHRMGAPVMSSVLATDRAYSLGLSATPERDDGREGDGDSASVDDEIGPIV